MGTHWGVSGTTAVANAYVQNPYVAAGTYISQHADVLLLSFAYNDLNPTWANADPSTLAWAQLGITINAQAAGYRCVVWLQQRSDWNGELTQLLEDRLEENRDNLSLLRETNLEQEPEFRVGLVDWAGETNGPTDQSMFSDDVHPSAKGGGWIGDAAVKAMAECD